MYRNEKQRKNCLPSSAPVLGTGAEAGRQFFLRFFLLQKGFFSHPYFLQIIHYLFQKEKNRVNASEGKDKNEIFSSLEAGKKWLDIYFSGKQPDFMPLIHMMGTPFRLRVWKLLLQIPYGKTITYGELAKVIAKDMYAFLGDF